MNHSQVRGSLLFFQMHHKTVGFDRQIIDHQWSYWIVNYIGSKMGSAMFGKLNEEVDDTSLNSGTLAFRANVIGSN